MVLTTLIQRDYVGLQTTSERIFKPLVKLNGNNANGIYFDADSWQKFLHNMGLMSEYLAGDKTESRHHKKYLHQLYHNLRSEIDIDDV